jgi:mono/diheme cytochrome c family protein
MKNSGERPDGMGSSPMRTPLQRGAIVLLSLGVAGFATSGVLAQATASAAALGATELLGMQLFNQHCRVCHTRPLLNSAQYGPVLSKSSLGGDDHALHDFIANGAPRMPGFKYSFDGAQIDAVVAYLKTVPAPPAP